MSTSKLAGKILRIIAAAAIMLPVLACAGPNGADSKDNGAAKESHTGENVGTILGAIGGALLGSQVGKGNSRTLGMVAGGALGALLGNNLGRRFDERDRALQTKAAEKAMTRPVGQAVPWSNPDSGNSGSVTPLKQETRASDGATCRSFEQRVQTKDGSTAATQGTACREPDGTWKVTSG